MSTDGYPKNFRPHEFNCKCDGEYCEGPSPHAAETRHLAWTLQTVRDAIGKPVHINSAYRCPAWNAHVGGSPQSLHVRGMAADIDIREMKAARVARIIDNMMTDGDIPNGGLGSYKTFTHMDIRKYPARWDG